MMQLFASRERSDLHVARTLNSRLASRSGGRCSRRLFVCLHLRNKRVNNRLLEKLQLAPTPHNSNLQILAAAFNNFKKCSNCQLHRLR
jgi:hypothetical protein